MSLLKLFKKESDEKFNNNGSMVFNFGSTSSQIATSKKVSITSDIKLINDASANSSRSKCNRSKTYPFILRNINPHEIYRKYKSGAYGGLIIDKSPINVATSNVNIVPDSSDRCQERFYETNNGTTSTILTTGQSNYELAVNNIHKGLDFIPDKTGLCKWCRGNLNERLPMNTYPTGVVTNVKKRGDKYIFTAVESKMCCAGCAISYAGSKEKYKKHIPTIKFMFNLIGVDTELTPAKDWELHQRNGGSLSDEEYYENDVLYISNGNIIVLPTKSEYVMMDQSQVKQNKY